MTYSIVLDARATTAHFPGIGRYIRNLARALPAELDDRERLVLLAQPSRGSDAAPDAFAEGTVRAVEVEASPFSLRQQWLIPRALRTLDAHLYHSAYYLMPYKPRVKTVLTIYDLIPMAFPGSVSVQARLLFRWATALAIRAAAHIITISEATRQQLLRAFSVEPSKATAVPLGVQASFRPQRGAIIEQVRRKYGLPARYVLNLGTNKPHKNLVRLVDAWSIAIRRDTRLPTPALVLAGPWDPRFQAPRARSEELALGKRVRFLGPVPEADLPGLLAGAEVFVCPSLMEGFGLPVLEAMACGAPVACSGTSSLPEVAQDAAVYFDPAQVEAIAEVLARLLVDTELKAELREQGLTRAEHFSWRNTAQQTVRVYRGVLGLETTSKQG